MTGLFICELVIKTPCILLHTVSYEQLTELHVIYLNNVAFYESEAFSSVSA